MNLRQLQDERAGLIRQAKAQLARAYPADAEPVDEEVRAYQAIERKLEANAVALDVVMAELDIERNTPPVIHPDRAAADLAAGRARVPLRDPLVMPRARPALGRTYREVFGGTPDTQGFHSLREFATTVWRGGMGDHRLLAAHTEMSEGIPTEGGFLVPTEYAAQMLDRALESEIVRPLADVQPMQSQTKRISDFDRSDASSGAPAGFAAVWMNEGDTATPVVPKTRTIELTAKKLGLWVNATNEVVADAPQFENLLGNQMPEAIAWSMDNAFLTGTGAGMPLGVLNDPALLTVTKEASQPSTTLKYENLVKMFASLHPSLVRDAVWVANPTTIPQLLRLIVVIQNVGATENVGGSFVPVISERNGQFTILTRPVYFTEKLPTLGTKGDILLANFSQYCIGMRREVSLATSIHVKWLQDEMAYRCIVRADGQGKWSQAYKNKQGTSLSWCVVVENR